MNSNSHDAYCKICSLRFVKKSVLKIHCSIIHGRSKSSLPIVALSEGSSLKCTTCCSRFALKDHLKKHIAQNHKEKKLFTCNICLKKLTRKSSLRYHTSRFHSTLPNPQKNYRIWSQCIRMDLNKRSGPEQKTITASKVTP